jgi:hypothetical protein
LKISDRTLDKLAKMVVGDEKHFPYRSSKYITLFFERCGLPFKHDGTTRPAWARERLAELNLGTSPLPDLPSPDLCRVMSEIMEKDDFDSHNEKMSNLGHTDPDNFAVFDKALESLNYALRREGLIAYIDETDRCHIRSTGTGVSTAGMAQPTRPLSQDEITQRQRLAAFLDQATEDEFTERVLVPLFQRLGFHRVSQTGHKEKILEFGKDLWMKFQLPTSHWLYFCAQIKKDKIDSNNASGEKNVANVLSQARMAIDHPIFDPEANRKVLLDNLYLISAGEITKAARTWLVEHLDAGMRRHIIFMDRDELLDQSARILLDLKLDDTDPVFGNIPF